MTAKFFYIKTYGCQMNVYDSGKIADLLVSASGMQAVEDPQDADLIILNTCAIRDKAEHKIYSDLGRFHLLQKKRPRIVIAVGGCVATQEEKKILERAPYVEIIFGPQTTHHLPIMYDEVLEKKQRQVDLRFLQNEKFSHFPKSQAKGPTALLTIMEGCNRFCSYCVVPKTRGREISRPIEDILEECTELSKQGVKEIHFLGQNVNAYLGKDKDGKICDLTHLLQKTAKIADILRIKFTTSHPAFLKDELINCFANESKIIDHFHLPVQSGSNAILKAMRRGYTVEEYKEKIYKLRAIRPNISISSDFIVGFPGETEDDFIATLNLVREIKFDQSFSFIYSKRPNTQAALIEDKTPLQEKRKRLMALQELLNKSADSIAKEMLNSIQKVFVQGKAERNIEQLTGQAFNNRTVNFIGSKDLIGKIVNVKITEVLLNTLRGTLV